jgi:ketosteroid isomerase-like protein
MTPADQSRHVVEQFWATMQTNDFQAVGELLHDDFVLEWPQSGERIRGRANFVAVNQQYPTQGRWSFSIHRLLADGDQVASEVTVTDSAGITGRAITFSTVRDGRIVHQTEYWPDPFAAAEWRAEWVERMSSDDDRR